MEMYQMGIENKNLEAINALVVAKGNKAEAAKTPSGPPPIPKKPAKNPTGKAVRTIKRIKKEYSFDKIELINLTC